MQLLTSYVFIFAFMVIMANGDSFGSFPCNNKYCFIETNSENERVLNCITGKVENDFIQCLYIRNNFKVMLLTKNDTYIKVDKIAPGTFQRLASGMIVKKVSLQKIIFSQLDSKDFEGLTRITEIQLENPRTLAHDTFLQLASTRDTFVLYILCNKENRNISFNELHFQIKHWQMHTYQCQNSVMCEKRSCNSSNEYPVYRLISTNETSSQQSSLSYRRCKEMSNCLQKEQVQIIPQKTIIQNPTESTAVTSKSISKSAKLVTTTKSEAYYDTLMWVVLWLTGINSIVIMGILIFLMIWLKRMSTSAANKKHTIILEDEDNTKYLKLSPYA